MSWTECCEGRQQLTMSLGAGIFLCIILRRSEKRWCWRSMTLFYCASLPNSPAIQRSALSSCSESTRGNLAARRVLLHLKCKNDACNLNSNLTQVYLKAVAERLKKCNAVQWTINSKNAIKRTQYKNIQQLIVQCSQIAYLASDSHYSHQYTVQLVIFCLFYYWYLCVQLSETGVIISLDPYHANLSRDYTIQI